VWGVALAAWFFLLLFTAGPGAYFRCIGSEAGICCWFCSLVYVGLKTGFRYGLFGGLGVPCFRGPWFVCNPFLSASFIATCIYSTRIKFAIKKIKIF